MTSKTGLLFSAFFILFYSLTVSAQTAFPAVHAITGIIEPVRLNADITRLKLTDYFKQPSQIDSLTFSKGIKHSWNKKDNIVAVTALPELKPIAEMKMWSKGFAYCVVLMKPIDTDKPDPGKPVINTSRLGRGSFTISVNYSRSPFSISCYWQNFKLGKAYIKRANEEMMVVIPDEAMKIKRTYIRIYANDDVSRSNDILIPLEYGEVVNDPKQLDSNDVRMTRNYLYHPIGSRFDPVAAFYFHKPFDTIAERLRLAMDRYGYHHDLSDWKFYSPKSFSFSTYNEINILLKDSSDRHLLMMMALVAAIPGDGIDSNCARDFNDQTDKMIASKLHDLGKSYLALPYGETDVAAKADIMMIKRRYFSQTVLFVFNKSKEKKFVETGLNLSEFRPAFGHTSIGEKVELLPLSFEVFVK